MALSTIANIHHPSCWRRFTVAGTSCGSRSRHYYSAVASYLIPSRNDYCFTIRT